MLRLIVIAIALVGCGSRVETTPAAKPQPAKRLDFGSKFVSACDDDKPPAPAALQLEPAKSCSLTASR